ncbi:hypothetical protein IC582_011217 [Cucumis melo]
MESYCTVVEASPPSISLTGFCIFLSSNNGSHKPQFCVENGKFSIFLVVVSLSVIVLEYVEMEEFVVR